MSHRNAFRFVLFVTAALLSGQSTAHANCDTITLSIQTAAGGEAVTGSNGVFSLSFGNVNGLGIGTLSAGVSRTTSATGATYTTPITVHTSFANCSGGLQNQTIKVYQSATTSTHSQAAAREGSAAASVISVPNSQATATTILALTNQDVSNQTLTRFVGLFVSNANGASSVTGSLAPKFIYEVTVH